MSITDTTPIDPASLTPVLAPIGQSRTLPAEAYTNPDVLVWELRHFFEGSWVCIGRSALLPRAGDQTAVAVGGEGMLLVRGDDDVLRGFFNTCRHRGHELLACGAVANERVIKCPYHAWVYGLDGSLRAAPRFSDLPETDPVCEGLVPRASRNGTVDLRRTPPGAAPPSRSTSAPWTTDRPVRRRPRSCRGLARVRGARRTGRSSWRTTTSATTAR